MVQVSISRTLGPATTTGVIVEDVHVTATRGAVADAGLARVVLDGRIEHPTTRSDTDPRAHVPAAGRYTAVTVTVVDGAGDTRFSTTVDLTADTWRARYVYATVYDAVLACGADPLDPGVADRAGRIVYELWLRFTQFGVRAHPPTYQEFTWPSVLPECGQMPQTPLYGWAGPEPVEQLWRRVAGYPLTGFTEDTPADMRW